MGGSADHRRGGAIILAGRAITALSPVDGSVRWIIDLGHFEYVRVPPAFATFHLWEINEIYSNADGTLQYIELFTASNNQQFTTGTTIQASQGASSNLFVFPGPTPAPTSEHHLLIATSDFASLPCGVTPDFTLPDGFLFTPDGTVTHFGANSMTYAVLPTDGILALHCDANNGVSCTAMSVGLNSPTNYAGDTGSIGTGGSCVDSDNDGFGFPGDASCPGGATDDCDDCDGTIFPGAPETPDDGIDQDCNGFDPVACFEDSDGDGFGSSVVVLADDGDCTDEGESGIGTDCDDTNASINPGAAEICDDDIDNDCDELIDEPGCNYPECGACRLHADVFPSTGGDPNGNPIGNCVVDLDDILEILAAFSATNQCDPHFPDTVNMFPCDEACSEGVVDLDDILSTLAAFSGTFGCSHPCPGGACCFGDSSCEDADGLGAGTTPVGGMSATTCVEAGGVYQGNFTTCDDVTCP